MPTTTYKLQLENFYRELGENVEVVLGVSSSTLNKPPGGSAYTPSRYTLDIAYDCFWRSGLALRRAIRKLARDDVSKITPNALIQEDILLTGSVGTLGLAETHYEIIFSDAVARYNTIPNQFPNCRRAIDLRTDLQSIGLRRSPSIKAPVFRVATNQITVYPIISVNPRFDMLSIQYLPAVIRLVASTNGSDTWNVAFSDLLIEGAVKVAKSEAGDIQLAQYFGQEILAKLPLISKPTENQGSAVIEEIK